MYEFDSVSVSTYEAASLAAKLSEKSAAGWEVVAIVPAGSDITAFVKRSSTGATDGSSGSAGSSSAATLASSAAAEPATGDSGAPVSEPSGWGTAPESSSSGSSWGQTSTTDSGWGSNSGASSSGGWGSSATSSTPSSTPTAPAQPATPSVPAGWYTDPAGRFELRYWDGSAWTEHVSRNGQQYTDPPVA